MSEYGRKRLLHNRRAAGRAITIGATRPVICDGEPPYGPWRDRPVADAHGPHPGPEDLSVGAVIVAHQVSRH
jgi:hypothetical protein